MIKSGTLMTFIIYVLSRNRDERKKPYTGDGVGSTNRGSSGMPTAGSGARRSSMNSPSTQNNRNIHNPRMPATGAGVPGSVPGSGNYSTPGGTSDSRNISSPYMDSNERWGHGRDR